MRGRFLMGPYELRISYQRGYCKMLVGELSRMVLG
jgi:hypothetical protein